MSLDSPGGGLRRHRSDNPNPVDIHVGWRVRLRRTSLGMSQEKLGEAIGLTFQQVQKYERGTNRIGASRLYELSRVLDVPVGFFFEDFADSRDQTGLTEPPAPRYDAATIGRDSMELLGLFQRILDPAMRQQFVDLARAVANAYYPRKDA
jgi:transcriptional regulator with XRE-family HTH domain